MITHLPSQSPSDLCTLGPLTTGVFTKSLGQRYHGTQQIGSNSWMWKLLNACQKQFARGLRGLYGNTILFHSHAHIAPSLFTSR